MDEPRHKLVKKPGWGELLSLCAVVTTAIIITVTYIVIPIVT